MALFSRLFKGDPKLEACAVSDPAHLTKGATGIHVSKIQTALLILDNATIDRNEIAEKTYGSSTAAAVLAYKTKRKIINPSYQNTADDIVGKITVVAMDKELVQHQHAAHANNACSGRRKRHIFV